MNTSIGDLFFSFEGRINRAKWWLGLVALIPVSLIVLFALYGLLGVSFASSAPTTGHTVAYIIAVLVTAYPISAVALKRLHDRDRPQWFLAVFWAPTVLSIVADITGLSATVMQGADGEMVAIPTTLGMVLGFVSLGIGVWMLIELGILKGTPGPNRYGPDPLARTVPAT